MEHRGVIDDENLSTMKKARKKYRFFMLNKSFGVGMLSGSFRQLSLSEIQWGVKKLSEKYNSLDPKPFVLEDISPSFEILLHTFQYLDMIDLQRAACVSKLWNYVASYKGLWKTVRLEDLRVVDWVNFQRCLDRHETDSLVVFLSDLSEQTQIWDQLCETVRISTSLRAVYVDGCTPEAFAMMADIARHLIVLDALHLTAGVLDIRPFTRMPNLMEMQMYGIRNGVSLKNIECLQQLDSLQFLSLSRVNTLEGVENYLPDSLLGLDLGPWNTLPIAMSSKTLPTMTNLRRLRLEHSHGSRRRTEALFQAIAELPSLYELELANFPLPRGFDKMLGKCSNINSLLLLMHFVANGTAAMNQMVMAGVYKLRETLKFFMWALPLDMELAHSHSYRLEVVPVLNCHTNEVELSSPCHFWSMIQNILPYTQVELLNVSCPHDLDEAGRSG